MVDDETQSAVLSRELIIQIGRMNATAVPFLGKARTENALSVERLRNDSKEPLQQGSRRDADAIAKIPVALSTCRIIMTHLSEVGRRLTIVHLVYHVCLHQSETLFMAPCLEISQCGMHHLGSCHVVNAPGIRQPVAGSDC